MSNWSPLTGSIAQSEIRSWYDFSRIKQQRGRAVRRMVDERSSELVQHRRERGCNGAVLANDQCGKGAADVMMLIQPRTSRD